MPGGTVGAGDAAPAHAKNVEVREISLRDRRRRRAVAAPPAPQSAGLSDLALSPTDRAPIVDLRTQGQPVSGRPDNPYAELAPNFAAEPVLEGWPGDDTPDFEDFHDF